MLKFLSPYFKWFRFYKISVGVLCPYLETSLASLTPLVTPFHLKRLPGKERVHRAQKSSIDHDWKSSNVNKHNGPAALGQQLIDNCPFLRIHSKPFVKAKWLVQFQKNSSSVYQKSLLKYMP